MGKLLSWTKILTGLGCGLLAVAVLAALPAPVAAQSLYGSLTGTVTDESGAAMPGASVTITQTETNVAHDVVTDETGNYRVPNLNPGTYEVVVKLQGFQTFTTKDIAVRPDLALRLDARMKVGSIQESVVVSGSAVVLQTESAAVQSLTTSDQLVTIPTSGRAWQTTVALMPGVAQPDYSQSGGSNNPTRAMSISVNGQPANNTVVRLDGVTQINQFFQQIQAYSPSLESIETVSVVTNSFDADQGMAGGASVNVQVKSGTNTLKGSAFEFAQDYKMKAHNYFLPAGDPAGSGSVHVFGGTAGGPIVRNKFFYFGSVESTRQRTTAGTALSNSGANGLRSLPPMEIRGGNFAGTGTVIYDPQTGGANGVGRVPFAFGNCGITSTADPRFDSCNFIPANRISPIATATLAKLIPPTLPGAVSNYYATNKYDTDYRKYDGKLTWVPNNRITVNGRLGYATSYEDSAPELPYVDDKGVITNGPNNPIWQGRIWDSTVHSHSLAITDILTSNFVMDGVFGFTRTDMLARPHTDTCWGDQFGIPNSCQPPLGRSTAFPQMSAGFSISGGGQPRAYRDPQWGGNINAGWTKSGHNVKFGGELKRLHQNHYETQSPVFTFTGGRTALSGGTAPNNFNQFADFLLGEPNSRRSEIMTPMVGIEQTGADFRPATLRSWQFGTFIRDQFELTRRMTVSAGVRWEYYPLSVRRDRGLEVFDFKLRELLICGVAGNPKTCGVTVEKNLFTPRLGWAYRPTDSMVIRVGYSRNPQNDTSGNTQQPPGAAFPATIIYTETGANSFTNIGTLAQGFPSVPILDLTVGHLPPVGGLTTYGQNAQFKRGKISSWNVSFQQVLPYGHSLTLGYVANRQNGMTRAQNQNYGQLGGGTASQPYASTTTSALNIQSPTGKVQYDSAQASVNKRMTNGLQYSFAYTYAKTLNWWADSIPQPQYWYLNKGETGLPHTLNISVVYELPFGTGRKFVANSGVISHVLGGWQMNTFITARSGSGLGAGSSAASLNAGTGTSQRADQVKDEVEIYGVGIPSPTTSYFDVLAFKAVTDVRFGNSPLLAFRGPSYQNMDLSLFRTFGFHNKTLQLRVEALNAFNTPHFSNPGTTISNLTFNTDGTLRSLNGVGVINSTNRLGRQYDEREWRLGMRFGF